jgi:hypothetical protein
VNKLKFAHKVNLLLLIEPAMMKRMFLPCK